jgi:hypothetical protein
MMSRICKDLDFDPCHSCLDKDFENCVVEEWFDYINNHGLKVFDKSADGYYNHSWKSGHLQYFTKVIYEYFPQYIKYLILL